MPYGVESLVNAGQKIIFYHMVSKRTVVFPAFVTQFEDQFTSDWNEEYAFGRMDPIATFKRTGRKINLGFQIVAGDVTDAQRNLGRISTLVKMLYPSYNSVEGQTPSATHLHGPPLMKIKFMNLIQNSANGEDLLGYVGGFSTSPILDSGFIELGPGQIFPKAYDISCTFTVLHTHKVGWYGSGEERHFAGNRDQGVNYPYRAFDPGYNEIRSTPSEPTNVQEGLYGGYSGIDPQDEAYIGLQSIEGGASFVAEVDQETLMSMPTANEDFPECLPSESQELNEAADHSNLMSSPADIYSL